MAKDHQHYWRAEGVNHPLNLSDLRCMSSLRLGLPLPNVRSGWSDFSARAAHFHIAGNDGLRLEGLGMAVATINRAAKGDMGVPAPPQSLDSGLAGLSLIAGYYRIAADSAQLSHQLALTGRMAGAEDIVRGANILQLKSRILRGVTAKRLGAVPYPALIGLKDGGFGVLGVGSTKGRARLIDPIGRACAGADDRGNRGSVLGRARPHHAPARRGRRRSQHVRLPLVFPLDPALPAPARPRADRLAVRADFRAGDANLLPARRRQGAGSQRHVDPGRARARHGDARPVRDDAAISAHLHAEPHHQPDRRRARPAAVSSSVPPAARLFRDPRGRADRRSHARARDDPRLSDRAGPDVRCSISSSP